MKYNPKIHHRRSIRLKGYDYSQAGAYFITICCENREFRFGKIENDEMVLNEYGMIAYKEWNKLPERFLNFELDVFQIMPNHMHGIIMLNNVGATQAVAHDNNDVNGAGASRVVRGDNNDVNGAGASRVIRGDNNDVNGAGASRVVRGDNNDVNGAGASPAPTVGDIVGSYKSLVANNCLDIYKIKNTRMGKLWQRNYYEHIIRDEKSCQTISNYIINNPSNWKDDKFYSNEAHHQKSC